MAEMMKECRRTLLEVFTPYRWSLVASSVCLLFISCIFTYRTAEEMDRPARYTLVPVSVKAHLIDGSMILFRDGFSFSETMIFGKGVHYDLLRTKNCPVDRVSFDSVACLEYYKTSVQTGPIIGSVIAPALFLAAVTSSEDIAKAIFGSCPTVYSYDGQDYSLQAECFSYSICPLFEAIDLDRIDKGRLVDDAYVLKVTNEALETHYINSMRLLYVDHPPGSEAFPDNNKKIMLFGPPQGLLSVKDRLGHDVLRLVKDRDDYVYRTDSQVVQELTERIVQDWIEVRAAVPDKAKKMIIALRMRNSLFNTVLLYDVMLRSKGMQALDWVGDRMNRIWPAWNLHKWYQKNFGMQVQVWNGGDFETRAHIGDAGPIAWRQVAVELPAPKDGPALIRLSFLPDNWMIDWVGVSFDPPATMKVHDIGCSKVEDLVREGRQLPAQLIRDRDGQYLVTSPAESYRLSFKVEDEPGSMQRTYFLRSCGYYIEWIRGNWLFADREAEIIPFELNDQTLTRTARLWLSKKEVFEKEFFNSKISNASRLIP